MTEDQILQKLNEAMLPAAKHDSVPSSRWVDALIKASNILYAASRTLPHGEEREPLCKHIRALNADIAIHQTDVRNAS
jgi:hypothetical protein